jgi:hypothetical protein
LILRNRPDAWKSGKPVNVTVSNCKPEQLTPERVRAICYGAQQNKNRGAVCGNARTYGSVGSAGAVGAQSPMATRCALSEVKCRAED